MTFVPIHDMFLQLTSHSIQKSWLMAADVRADKKIVLFCFYFNRKIAMRIETEVSFLTNLR
ncbi:hypothetical protein RI196_04350 [Aeribacillus composti]|uniref:Uncharacterized protein n=1 Tax=Aeribacillus composti TaxID=1868734 RepID=A0ABY9WE47_9BACI|nr:hypothetical protein [Aeribacillus composti]WNF33923.1 hypothetical protein RI196_04350 [Aeribacillus composti]